MDTNEPGPRRPHIIAVTGATGRQGGAVARRLAAEGWTVRGLTRDPAGARAAALHRDGVEVVQADLDRRDTLDAALQGAAGVYSVQNPLICGHEQEIVQGCNVADAAAAAGVSHLVYGSAGVGEPTGIQQWDAKLVVAEHTRQAGVPLTTLRPMAFMELMSDRTFYPSVSVWHLMPKLMGEDRPVPWVAVADLAVVAAAAFARPEAFVGRDIPVAADVRSIAECRAIWRDVSGRAPRSFPMPIRLFERFVGADTTRMWRWLRDNPVPLDTQPTLEIHPQAATVRDWVAQRRAAPAG